MGDIGFKASYLAVAKSGNELHVGRAEKVRVDLLSAEDDPELLTEASVGGPELCLLRRFRTTSMPLMPILPVSDSDEPNLRGSIGVASFVLKMGLLGPARDSSTNLDGILGMSFFEESATETGDSLLSRHLVVFNSSSYQISGRVKLVIGPNPHMSLADECPELMAEHVVIVDGDEHIELFETSVGGRLSRRRVFTMAHTVGALKPPL